MAESRQKFLLRKFREGTSFDVDELTNIIHDGPDRVQARRDAWNRVEKIIGTADINVIPAQYKETSREKLYEEGLESGRAHWIDSIRHNHDFFDALTPRYALINSSPFGLNSMFRKAIELLASEQQQAEWLPNIYGGRWNGSYIQTELGHGTKFTHIETTATYCKEFDTFDLHTPTTTAIKFWPGCLGYSATHGVLMARLVIPDDEGVELDHGVHLFLVVLRDSVTGEPTPGIELGDIGLKPAHNQNDNGYAVFNHVHVPRTNMLMGEHTLDSHGRYTKVAHTKAMHQTMSSIRSYLPSVCSLQLAQAVTIATRYSIAREQGRLPFSGPTGTEIQIIRYKSQHFRLLTSLSKAYAILFMSKSVESVQRDLEVRRSKLDFSTFGSSHALQAGAKAWASETAAQSAEDARKCCGGQGYLNVSGLPEIVSSLTAICTLEGDNFPLWQQTAGYLAKAIEQVSNVTAGAELDSGSLVLIDPDLAYLVSADVGGDALSTPLDLCSRTAQLSIYRHRALKCIEKAADRFAAANINQDKSQTWNQEMMSLISAARAHIEYLVLQRFWAAVDAIPTKAPSQNLRLVLERLCCLFALSHIISPFTADGLTFLESNIGLAPHLDSIRDTVNELLEMLLPDIVGLTDAWDFTDASLASAIGMKDGDCYERLISWTRQLPMNVRAQANNGVDPRFESGVKPGLLRYGMVSSVSTPPGSLHLFSNPELRWQLKPDCLK